MGKYSRFVSTNILFWGINTIVFVLITPLAMHVMGQVFYGLWVVLLSILLVISNIGTLGMLHVTNKFASQLPKNGLAHNEHLGSVLSSGIIILLPASLLATSILLLTRPTIITLIKIPSNSGRSEFYRALTWGAIALVPIFLSRVPAGLLLGQLHNGIVRGLEVGGNILLWGGAVLIAWFGYGINYMAQWMLILNIAIFLIYLWAIHNKEKVKVSINTRMLHEMLHFSLYTFLETIAIALFQQVDRILVGITLGPAAAGVYAVGTSIGLRITMVAKQFTDVMVPYASLQNSIRAHTALYNAFHRLVKYTSLLSGVLAGVLILWMDRVLSAWISPSYSAQYTLTFRTIVFAYGMFTLAHPGRQTLLGMGRMRFVSTIYLFASSGMLTVLYLLIQHINLMGAAIANFVMILLLCFDFKVYSILTTHWWKQAISDLIWGSILAGGAYLSMLFWDSMSIKLGGTFLLGITAFIILIKDQFLALHVQTYSQKLLVILKEWFISR